MKNNGRWSVIHDNYKHFDFLEFGFALLFRHQIIFVVPISQLIFMEMPV